MSIRNYSEAISALAECYRLTGADPDGNEDWRLAEKTVSEVCNFRKENDETERLWLADLEELENIFGLDSGGSIGSQVMAAARSVVTLNAQQSERIKRLYKCLKGFELFELEPFDDNINSINWPETQACLRAEEALAAKEPHDTQMHLLILTN